MFTADHELLIGKLDRSNCCSLGRRACIGRPLLFSIHERPLALFVTIQQDDLFLVTSFVLPSFAVMLNEALPAGREVTCLCYHKDLNYTFFATASRQNGDLYAVGEVFDELKIVKQIEIEGGVFCMTPVSDNELILGGTCRVVRVRATVSASGFVELAILQTLATNVVPRSLSAIGNLVLHFGFQRSITILIRRPDGKLEKAHEHFLTSQIHTGFAGSPLSDHACHLFTVDLDRTLTIYALRIRAEAEKLGSITELTAFRLESRASSFSMVRDGFALLATQDGALYTLIEYDRKPARSLQAIAREIGGFFPFKQDETAVIDGDALSLFTALSVEAQNQVCEKAKIKKEVALSLIQGLSRHIGSICSTL
jgi:hypothetical protein